MDLLNEDRIDELVNAPDQQVYHWTTADALRMIFKTQTITGRTPHTINDATVQGVSLTRNAFFDIQDTYARGGIKAWRIGFSLQRLKHNHKVVPMRYAPYRNKPRNQTYREPIDTIAGTLGMRDVSSDESEEFLIGDLTNIWKYVTSISVEMRHVDVTMHPSQVDWDDEPFSNIQSTTRDDQELLFDIMAGTVYGNEGYKASWGKRRRAPITLPPNVKFNAIGRNGHAVVDFKAHYSDVLDFPEQPVHSDPEPVKEAFAHAFKPQYGPRKEHIVTVFINPNSKEWRECLGKHQMARGYAVGKDFYAWSAYDAVHNTVHAELNLPKDAIPVYAYSTKFGQPIMLTVTDASLNTIWWHSDKVGAELAHGCDWLVNNFPEIEVDYYDQDIYGDWTMLDDEDEETDDELTERFEETSVWNNNVKFFIDPTRGEFQSLLNSATSGIRGAYDASTGDIYMWDAMDSSHADARDALYVSASNRWEPFIAATNSDEMLESNDWAGAGEVWKTSLGLFVIVMGENEYGIESPDKQAKFIRYFGNLTELITASEPIEEEILDEAPFDKVELKNSNLQTYKIGSHGELERLLQNFGWVRMFVMPDGIIAWDAANATHHDLKTHFNVQGLVNCISLGWRGSNLELEFYSKYQSSDNLINNPYLQKFLKGWQVYFKDHETWKLQDIHQFGAGLTEAPIGDWQVDPNFDSNEKEMMSKFTGYEMEAPHWSAVDKKAMRDPGVIKKAQNAFMKTLFTFDMYFWQSTNPDYDPTTQKGYVDLEWVQKKLGKEAYEYLSKANPNHITMILGSNMSDQDYISLRSPWIIAHRMAHTLISGRNKLASSYSAAYVFENFVHNILEIGYDHEWPDQDTQYGHIIYHDHHEIYTKMMGHYLGTMRSARSNKLVTASEWIHESFAQYIITGKITLNPLPDHFDEGMDLTTDPERRAAAQHLWSELPNQVKQAFDELLEEATGKIWIM
jgi:hypothetical protein